MSQEEAKNSSQPGLAVEVVRTHGLSKVRPREEVIAYRFPVPKGLSIAPLVQRALHELSHFDAHLALSADLNIHIKHHLLTSVPYLVEILGFRPRVVDHAFAPMIQALLISTAESMFHVSSLITEEDLNEWRALSEHAFPMVAFMSNEVIKSNIDFVVDRALSGYEVASHDVTALPIHPAHRPTRDESV